MKAVQTLNQYNLYSYLLHRLVSLISGYRFLKITSHLTGFMTVYLITFSVLYNLSDLSVALLLGISGCAGAAAGFITVLIRPLALISLALQASGLVGCLILMTISYLFEDVTLTQLGCTMTACSVLLVILSLQPCVCKAMVIANTSVISGGLALCVLDAYINKLRIIIHIISLMRFKRETGICEKSWALVSVWLLLTLSGVLLQTMFTARGVKYDHGESVCNIHFEALVF